ncbi:response regulator transcription factor [Halomonas aquamarina]|uniref:Response regulator transcription factor n=1 Tax=Vreelandella aquamarina TaxID=77097 RepID=A0ACC5VUI5_9GAMM|nr:response regulator transcription factor [Halomonas aquamarina]MBZ5487968.1 response regulator transcription factor [Halomonas aquamarina]
MAKVLIVDGEPNFLLSIEMLIEQAGFEVIGVTNGEQALERLGTDALDIVLLDINLPGMSGFEVLEALRANTATTRLPIIMLTAHGHEVEREKSAALGASGYMPKPFSPQALIEQIHALLGEKTA